MSESHFQKEDEIDLRQLAKLLKERLYLQTINYLYFNPKLHQVTSLQ